MSALERVDFRGDALWAVRGDDGEVFVAVKPICRALGVEVNKQVARIRRDPILAEGTTIMVLPSAGGAQETVLLRLDLVNGWLFGIDADRVRPEARETVLAYQRDCHRALFRHFHRAAVADTAADAEAPPAASSAGAVPLPERVHALNLVRECRIVFGAAAARGLWNRLDGLPAVPVPALPGPDPADDGGACLVRLIEAGGVQLPGVRTAELDHEPGIAVANRHAALSAVFAGTPWAAGRWSRALLTMPGARRWPGTMRFGDVTSRAVWVPHVG